jgi:hypothetical protein
MARQKLGHDGGFGRIYIALLFGEGGQALKADPRFVCFGDLVIEQSCADYPDCHQVPVGLSVDVALCVSL